MGGTQTYSAAKASWMEAHGWDVSIISDNPQGVQFKIPYLEKFEKSKCYWLSAMPCSYPAYEVRQYVKYMKKQYCPHHEQYNEIVIESHYLYVHLWGELLAESLGAKHMCILLNELFRGSGHEYDLYLDFYNFKLSRKELPSSEKRYKLLFDGYRDIHYNGENLWPISESPLADIDSAEVNAIKKYDYNILFTSRMEKSYVPIVLSQISLFASKHLNKIVQCILIGDTSSCREMISETLISKNLIITELGTLSPIPRSIISIPDVFVGGSGCADYPVKAGALTISVDAYSGEAIGIVGYETNNTLYIGDNDNPSPLSDALERALIQKTYLTMQYAYKSMTNDECCERNLLTIKESSQKKEYYDPKKIIGEKKASLKQRMAFYGSWNFPKTWNMFLKIYVYSRAYLSKFAN